MNQITKIKILSNIPILMLICLTLTLVIELIVSLILKVRDKKDILNIILVNILTNPILVSTTILINYKFGIEVYNIVIYIFEIIVVFVEGLIYKKYLNYKKINPYLLSLILNICSYVGGLLFNYFVL